MVTWCSFRNDSLVHISIFFPYFHQIHYFKYILCSFQMEINCTIQFCGLQIDSRAYGATSFGSVSYYWHFWFCSFTAIAQFAIAVWHIVFVNVWWLQPINFSQFYSSILHKLSNQINYHKSRCNLLCSLFWIS